MAKSRRRSPRARPFSRRAFIQRMTFFGGGVVFWAACERKPPAGKTPKAKAPGIQRTSPTTSHRTFTDAEFEVLSAACERVLPKDEDPGAVEARVPYAIDNLLQSPELKQLRADFVAGLMALDRRSGRMFKTGFATATAAQQDELLTLFRDSPPPSGEAHFFDSLIALTMEGFLGDPSYGGNKDRVGWTLVGFETSEPPPGYDGLKALHRHDHGEP